MAGVQELSTDARGAADHGQGNVPRLPKGNEKRLYVSAAAAVIDVAVDEFLVILAAGVPEMHKLNPDKCPCKNLEACCLQAFEESACSLTESNGQRWLTRAVVSSVWNSQTLRIV